VEAATEGSVRIMSRLGELERAVMEVLWERATPATAREVGRTLADRDLAYTTVMTVLDRLAKKGFVQREQVGRAWSYTPTASREAYITRLMLDALDLTGDRDAALVRFARSVSGAEAELLREALDEVGAEDPPKRGRRR
jgi:predicted transcriptional regulator